MRVVRVNTVTRMSVSSCAHASDFGPAVTIASGLSSVLAGAAIDTNGEALVAWQASSTARQKARFPPAGGLWSAPATIGPRQAKLGSFPALRFKADDSAIAVTTNGTNAYSADMAPGHNWRRPRSVLVSAAAPVLVVNEAGNAAVVAGLMAVRRVSGAKDWSAPEAIPTPPTGTDQLSDHAELEPQGDLLVPMISFDINCSQQGCEYDVALYAAREAAPRAGWSLSSALWARNFCSDWRYDSAAAIDSQHGAAVVSRMILSFKPRSTPIRGGVQQHRYSTIQRGRAALWRV